MELEELYGLMERFASSGLTELDWRREDERVTLRRAPAQVIQAAALLLEIFIQRHAIQVLHYDIGRVILLKEVIDIYDIGIIAEFCHIPRLGQKAVDPIAKLIALFA